MPVAAREPARTRLLRGAEAVLLRTGFADATPKAIAREADVAVGTFYVFFPDVRAILVELLRTWAEHLHESFMEVARAGHATRLAFERARFSAFVEFVEGHRGLFTIAHLAAGVAPEAHRSFYRELATSFRESTAQAVETHGIPTQALETLAYAQLGLHEAVLTHWLASTEAPPSRRALERAFEGLLHNLTPRRG